MGIFKFRKFAVCDDHAGMKVGTDAVLLGAWSDLTHSKRILDIGTGSGVIALMAAQRSDARIDAVELQQTDFLQASENFQNSEWNTRIQGFHSAIQEFQSDEKYDVILCNPPYFTKSLLPPALNRELAKHDTSLSHEELIIAVLRLINSSGRFNVILPPTEGNAFVATAEKRGLYLTRLTRFFTRKGKAQERSLMEFRINKTGFNEDELLLYNEGINRSAAYQTLTADFYLERLNDTHPFLGIV